MYILRRVTKTKKQIFKEPEPGSKPPMWIRAILITTCTLVSFFHGNNDGQKGIGLMLIILITFMPVKFALNDSFNADLTLNSLNKIENTLASENKADLVILTQKTKETIDSYKVTMANDSAKTEDK